MVDETKVANIRRNLEYAEAARARARTAEALANRLSYAYDTVVEGTKPKKADLPLVFRIFDRRQGRIDRQPIITREDTFEMTSEERKLFIEFLEESAKRETQRAEAYEEKAVGGQSK